MIQFLISVLIVLAGRLVYLSAGYFVDSIKERTVMFIAGILYNRELKKDGFVNVGGLIYRQVWKEINNAAQYTYRKQKWSTVKPPFMGHDKGWQFIAHSYALFVLGTLVAIFDDWRFAFCVFSFLDLEYGYYLRAYKEFGRWIPKSYNLGGFITPTWLFIFTTLGMVLSYILPIWIF